MLGLCGSLRYCRNAIQIVFGLARFQVTTSGDIYRTGRMVDNGDRVDFDESILPEDSSEIELDADEYEVEKILDVRSGRKTRYGRIHKQ